MTTLYQRLKMTIPIIWKKLKGVNQKGLDHQINILQKYNVIFYSFIIYYFKNFYNIFTTIYNNKLFKLKK